MATPTHVATSYHAARRPFEEVRNDMGQPIQVAATRLDDVVMFDTDRSITGQDGAGFSSRDDAEADTDFPAQLAARLFAQVTGVDHVFIASNQVVVQRSGGWGEADIDAATQVIADFFLYYPDTPTG
jgi:hypothetical protein